MIICCLLPGFYNASLHCVSYYSQSGMFELEAVQHLLPDPVPELHELN